MNRTSLLGGPYLLQNTNSCAKPPEGVILFTPERIEENLVLDVVLSADISCQPPEKQHGRSCADAVP